jgi:XTP/dITP diphosphohydrolase
MKDVPEEKRTARFVCAIALVGLPDSRSAETLVMDADGALKTNAGMPSIRHVFEGRCEGRIAFSPSGAGGFGYDPIFIDSEIGRTFADLSEKEKSARSHRGKALRAMVEYLESLADGCPE